MAFDLWLAFALASTALLIIPGPTVILVVSYALGQGRSSGWATVPGVVLGDCLAMTASLLGAGALLATSATLFTALKFFGAAYLIWLGVKLWRAEPRLETVAAGEQVKGKAAMFWNAFVVTALNPKSIVFFVAFLPPFVDTSRPVLPQFIILEATFLVLAGLNVAVWAVLAGGFKARFQSPRLLKAMNRVGGSFLIGAGLLAAAVRRSS